MERLAQAELTGVGRRLRSTAPVELARKTAELQVRVKALTRSLVAIVVDVDGELYRCEAEFEAGPYLDRSGASSDWTVLGYVLPYGHFDNKPASREEWAEMPMRRLGEYAKTPLRAWVEVTGSAEVEFMGEAQDAPRGWHSSVAYQNAGSGYAASSATVSFSFTAGAGSDRAAFLFGAGSRDTRPTSSALTFGGGSPSVALGEMTNTYWRGRGAIVKDAEIDTGAKTVQFTNSGGGGTTYFHAVMAVSFTGVDQTTPNGTAGTDAADSGTALSITVSSPASDSLVVDGWAWVQQNSTNPTIGADQTIRVNGSPAAGVRYVASTQLGSDGGVMSWTKATSGWEYVGMAVEMKAVSAGGGVEVTPGVASLTTARQTPTVAATANQEVSPGIIALTTARQTPTVATPTVVTPGIVALTASPQSPTVAATANQNVTPGIIALVTANQTPTVAATANVNVSPAQLAAALTAQTPEVEATSGVTVFPGILELVTALQAPSVATPVGVSPGILEAVLTAFAASVATPTVVTPGIVELATARQTPTVAFTANQNVTPDIIELATTRYTPEADATSGLTLVPGSAAMVTALFAATVAATANQNVSPAQLALVTTMFAATVATPVEVAPGIGTLVTARFAPTVTVPLVLVPGTATLVTARFAPAAVGDAVNVWGLVAIRDESRFVAILDDVGVWRVELSDAPAFLDRVRDE